MQDVVIKFNSVTEFDRFINNRENSEAWAGLGSSQDTDRVKWYGTKTFEDAENILIHGDEKNYKKLLQIAGTNEIKPQFKTQKQLYSCVVGSLPNVPAYVAGAPNSMIAQRTIKAKQKVVNICFFNCWADGDKTDDIIKVSFEMLQKVMQLESTGTRVNLYTAALTDMHKRDNNFGYVIKIKDSAQKLDVLKTVYPMVNPAMLRRQGFRFFEVAPGVPYCSTYGTIIHDETRLKKALAGAGVRDVVFIHGRYLLGCADVAKRIDDKFKQ